MFVIKNRHILQTILLLLLQQHNRHMQLHLTCSTTDMVDNGKTPMGDLISTSQVHDKDMQVISGAFTTKFFFCGQGVTPSHRSQPGRSSSLLRGHIPQIAAFTMVNEISLLVHSSLSHSDSVLPLAHLMLTHHLSKRYILRQCVPFYWSSRTPFSCQLIHPLRCRGSLSPPGSRLLILTRSTAMNCTAQLKHYRLNWLIFGELPLTADLRVQSRFGFNYLIGENGIKLQEELTAKRNNLQK